MILHSVSIAVRGYYEYSIGRRPRQIYAGIYRLQNPLCRIILSLITKTRKMRLRKDFSIWIFSNRSWIFCMVMLVKN